MQPEVFICGVPHYAYDYITSLYLCKEVFQKYLLYFLSGNFNIVKYFCATDCATPRLSGWQDSNLRHKVP